MSVQATRELLKIGLGVSCAKAADTTDREATASIIRMRVCLNGVPLGVEAPVKVCKHRANRKSMVLHARLMRRVRRP